MYNNLSLYYLEQLGIKPWVRRNENLQKKKWLLIVLLDGTLSNKARFLLDKILDYIRFDQEYNSIITIENPDLSILNRYGSRHGLIVLNFRTDFVSEQLKQSINSEINLLDMTSPDDLLNQPVAKKKVFQQVVKIKDLLAS